jgi:hypothetical protein
MFAFFHKKTGPLLALGIVISAGLQLISVPAFAQSNICSRISSELNTLRNQRSRSAFEEIDQLYHRQLAELRRAERTAERNGCYGRRANVPRQCYSLFDTLQKMERNIDVLERRRASASRSGGGNQRRIAQLERAYDANGCGRRAEPREERRGFFSTLFGLDRDDNRRDRERYPRRRTLDEAVNERETIRGLGNDLGNQNYDRSYAGYTYRTLCVRSCDGFYWPISFSTTATFFDRDQQTCNAMCPGTETHLYVHRNPGEEVESAVSFKTSKPYTALPTAFNYRKSFDKSCSCGANFKPVLASPKRLDGDALMAEAEETLGAKGGIPLPRPSMSLDPDTIKNRWGGLNLDNPPTLTASGGRNVRIVGPGYSYLGAIRESNTEKNENPAPQPDNRANAS